MGAQSAALRRAAREQPGRAGAVCYAPATERARRVLSKLRQAPRLIQAARDNVKDPPGIFVKISLETFRGAMTFIERDLPRAFARRRRPASARRSRRRLDRGGRRHRALHRLPRDAISAPQRARRSGSGASSFDKAAARRRLRRRADRLLAIAMRELRATQEEFRRVAGRLERRRSARCLARGQGSSIPPPASWCRPRSSSSPSSPPSSSAHASSRCRRAEPVVVAPSPDFYRWTFASMWTPGPFESRPLRRTTTSPTSIRPWSPERQEEHLRDFNYPGALVHLHPRGLSRATSSTTSTCGGSSRSCASRSCLRRRRLSKAGRTTASR